MLARETCGLHFGKVGDLSQAVVNSIGWNEERDQSFDYFTKLREIVDLLYPIQLESERLISAKPALAGDYERGSISLYRNVRREGVVV